MCQCSYNKSKNKSEQPMQIKWLIIFVGRENKRAKTQRIIRQRGKGQKQMKRIQGSQLQGKKLSIFLPKIFLNSFS